MVPSIPKPNWDPFFQKKEVSAATEAGKYKNINIQNLMSAQNRTHNRFLQ